MSYVVKCGCGWKGRRSMLENVDTIEVRCPACKSPDRLVDSIEGAVLKIRRAPQDLFDGFAEAPEAEKADRRRRAIEWLELQPKLRNTVYIMPHPDTGADLLCSHPGVH